MVLLAATQTASPERGMIQPAQADYTVTAAGASITVTITRTVGAAGPVGCSYTTVNGTAVGGIDYTATSGLLSWANNDSGNKTVVIPILDDGVVNGNKTFSLRLHTPTGGAFLGVPPPTAPNPLKNHEGRVLGTTPVIAGPVDWNTATADAILQTLQILPANNPWNEDISGLPVSSESDGIVAFMGAGTALHVNRDMNLTIVPGSQTKKTVTLTLYGGESDPGPYPVPDNTPIEGYLGDDTRTLANSQLDNPLMGGDRHATIIDPVNGYIYEFGNMVRDAGFNWTATGEATFRLRSNTVRPDTWTSADAAGLPILPSIPRYDECERGMVEHALRVTASGTRNSYVWPATHKTSSNSSVSRPRMGERLRLKKNAGVDAKITAMRKHPKAIALALQKYGMFVADNGSNWYLSTNSDDNPRLQFLNDLQTLIGSDFEVVVTTGPHEGPRAASTAVITITDGGGGGGGDSTPPTISITTPSSPTSSTTSASLLVQGTAGDNVAVTSVTWTNSAGGSGTASGTTAWNSLISLTVGTNTLTFTAHDGGGNNTSAVATVTYAPPPPSPGGGGGGGGGGCGLSGLELLVLWAFFRGGLWSRRQ